MITWMNELSVGVGWHGLARRRFKAQGSAIPEGDPLVQRVTLCYRGLPSGIAGSSLCWREKDSFLCVFATMAMQAPAAVVTVALLALLRLHVSVEAWGADGHHATCLIAEPLLAVEAVEAVRSLLPDYANGSLASLCTWPDDIKWQRKWLWTSPVHYIDTPDFLCRYNYDRDCHNEYGDKDMCVSGGINNYTSQLSSFHSPQEAHQYNLTEALLFLAHYVGDIHQPLHVAFTSDAGGNTISVHFYTRKYNLHHIWDTEMITRAEEQFYNSSLQVMTESILNNVTGNWLEEAKDWANCADGAISCPDIYAAESISLACKWAYRNATPGSTLKDEYFLSRLPIVERRLAQGGVRLAAILNRLFVTKHVPYSGDKRALSLKTSAVFSSTHQKFQLLNSKVKRVSTM